MGGQFRGRRLCVPPGRRIRPTSEKVREAIFDVLGAVDGLVVLDVFAGTGAFGLEALSRGATWCTFIEADRFVVNYLRENIAALDLQKVTEVIVANYTSGLRVVAQRDRRYDVVFMDPPYALAGTVVETLENVLPKILALGGSLVMEGPRHLEVPASLPVVFRRTYGDTSVHIMKREGET